MKKGTPLGKMKVSEAIPYLQIGVIHFNLRLSFQRDWNKACMFVNRSFKLN